MRVDNVAALSLQNIVSRNRTEDSREERSSGLKISENKNNNAEPRVSEKMHEQMREIDKSQEPEVVYSKSNEVLADMEGLFESKEVAIKGEDDVVSENINASKSRIRDVNMAEEVVNETKSHMIKHSSSAILAQANKKPEQILKLLE